VVVSGTPGFTNQHNLAKPSQQTEHDVSSVGVGEVYPFIASHNVLTTLQEPREGSVHSACVFAGSYIPYGRGRRALARSVLARLA